MAIDDKAKNKVNQVIGKAKETIGEITDNEQLEAEGRLQGAKAKVAEKVDDFKETVKDAVEDLKDASK
jgi:uncharacterized protein YjbJ (UPF0337 family)